MPEIFGTKKLVSDWYEYTFTAVDPKTLDSIVKEGLLENGMGSLSTLECFNKYYKPKDGLAIIPTNDDYFAIERHDRWDYAWTVYFESKYGFGSPEGVTITWVDEAEEIAKVCKWLGLTQVSPTLFKYEKSGFSCNDLRYHQMSLVVDIDEKTATVNNGLVCQSIAWYSMYTIESLKRNIDCIAKKWT